MAPTDKYELDTTNYGTTGWNALNATAFETLDDKVHTYLRNTVASGDSIAAYDPVQIYQGQWRKAQADGARSPAHGIAIEAGTSGEYTRAQRTGPLANTAWNWAISGEIYLSATGTLTQVAPAANVQIMGYPIDPDTILIHPQQSLVASGSYVETSSIVTEVGSPGSDASIPSEQAVREVLAGLPLSGEWASKSEVGGGGDVYGPTPTTENKVPQWDAAAKTLKDGLTVGTAASNLVQLDGDAKLPAVDGSQLTGIAAGSTTTVYTKTDDYTILSGELGDNVRFRMNAVTEKSFTLPAGVAALDGKRACLEHQNDNAKMNALAQGTNRIGFSVTAPGSMYHNISGEAGANVTLEWNQTLNSWVPVGAFGTWGIS